MTTNDQRKGPQFWLARHLPLLLLLHIFLLVLIRILANPDDFSNWDLIPFLNANVAASLSDLLQRPEVHFPNPFTFPLYNTGPESVSSAIMFRILGHVSLYWSNVIVLMVYVAVFFYLLYRLIQRLFTGRHLQSLALILLAMSPVLLTNASTSAFNMQGYIAIILGIYGIEVYRAQRAKGTALLAMSFLLVSQGYPIAFFLPYYLLVWAAWSLSFQWLCRERPGELMGRGGLVMTTLSALLIVAVLATSAHYLSGGTYFGKISLLNPHDTGNPLGSLDQLVSRLGLFLRQSFRPGSSPEGLSVGFAPYFIFATIIFGLLVMGSRGLMAGQSAKPLFGTHCRNPVWYVFLIASLGLVAFGYLPGFLNPVVKSQRVLMGDVFLVIVVIGLLSQIVWRPYAGQGRHLRYLLVLLILSDAYYLTFSTLIDHSSNHYPVFDFDLSDGRVRHDLIAAARLIKQQAEDESVLIVIDYPRSYSENTTDPGMFYAHLLRHFGDYQGSDQLVYVRKWCDFRYGCPFPEVSGSGCINQGCFRSPDFEINAALEADREVVVWQWHDTPTDAPAYLSRFTSSERMNVLASEYSASDTKWRVFDVSSRIAVQPGRRVF
jgi:hypothetical protein